MSPYVEPHELRGVDVILALVNLASNFAISGDAAAWH
jgi:hypothetical protein